LGALEEEAEALNTILTADSAEQSVSLAFLALTNIEFGRPSLILPYSVTQSGLIIVSGSSSKAPAMYL